jgi:hypothetical protein
LLVAVAADLIVDGPRHDEVVPAAATIAGKLAASVWIVGLAGLAIRTRRRAAG